MNAISRNGVSTDLDVVKDKLLKVALKLGKLDDKTVAQINSVAQFVIDDTPWEVENLKPKSFPDFLKCLRPTQSTFNQMVSELSWLDLLNQIEESCFLNEPVIEKARPFIVELWKNEVAQNPFKPPTNWKYLSPKKAVKMYQKITELDLEASSTLKIAEQIKSCRIGEGAAVWPKLSTLTKIFSVSGNPLEDTEQGRKAYSKIVKLLISLVGGAYTKAYSNYSFKGERARVSVNNTRLTFAGRKAWQRLEQATNDDFTIAPANSGSLYAGHSVRHSRIKMTLSEDSFCKNYFPQDCIMVALTIAVQPDRLTKNEHLSIDCPGTCHASDSRKFSLCPFFYWDDGVLQFDNRSADNAHQEFGSASFC